MSAPTRVALLNGAAAEITSSDGDKTTIQCSVSSPPGSTLRGNIEGVSCEFQLKVRSCRKTGESFSIDGRAINASRQMRETLRNSPQLEADKHLLGEIT